jgi:DNA-binding response OmpR family regulator
MLQEEVPPSLLSCHLLGDQMDRTQNNSKKILVVEDEKEIRMGLKTALELEGYEVLLAVDGDQGMTMAFDLKPHLIILDIMLPGFSGLEVLEELRVQGEDVPVLILSARGSLNQRVEGLKLGADDYLAKPFELAELLARVEALLRRQIAVNKVEKLIRVGSLELSPGSMSASFEGNSLELTTREFRLLHLLARNSGNALSRESILRKVWGWDFEGTERTVDNFILSLRKKLGDDPRRPRIIRTIRGVGYRLEQDPS